MPHQLPDSQISVDYIKQINETKNKALDFMKKVQSVRETIQEKKMLLKALEEIQVELAKQRIQEKQSSDQDTLSIVYTELVDQTEIAQRKMQLANDTADKYERFAKNEMKKLSDEFERIKLVIQNANHLALIMSAIQDAQDVFSEACRLK